MEFMVFSLFGVMQDLYHQPYDCLFAVTLNSSYALLGHISCFRWPGALQLLGPKSFSSILVGL